MGVKAMTQNASSLASRRGPSALVGVTQVLDTFAARDHNGEILTAVRHYPAREAQWADFPEWVHGEVRAAYNTKGIHRLYTHSIFSPPKRSHKTSWPSCTT